MVEVPDPTADDLALAGGYSWEVTSDKWATVTMTAYGTDAIGSTEIDDAILRAQELYVPVCYD